MNYTKEELEDLILNKKISYRELGRINNVSDTYIKKVAKNLGIQLPVRAKFPENWKHNNKQKKKRCKFCDLEIENRQSLYCSFKCMGLATKNKTKLKYDDAVKNNENIAKYCNISTFKPYILEEQDYKCAICKISQEWNGLPLVFVLDHIDGKADNNKRSNLRCVCPNCDSQLPTFKSKNKNSDRKDRYLLNYKNIKNEGKG